MKIIFNDKEIKTALEEYYFSRGLKKLRIASIRIRRKSKKDEGMGTILAITK